MRYRAALCVVLCASLAVAATAAEPVKPRPSSGCERAEIERGRRLAQHVSVGGVQRHFILDVPDTLQPRIPAPLLLDFHGFGHSGAGVWNVSGFRDLAPQGRFITVYPEGLPVRLTINGQPQEGAGWEIFAADGNRDVAFVSALLDDLERRYCIDRSRIFATGFSNGAFLSALLACTLSDRIAAVAPVSGGPLRVACTPKRGVPILIQHGRQDTLLPITAAHKSRDEWLTMNACASTKTTTDGPGCERWTACRGGAVVEYCEGDYPHRWPPEATERVWQFFQAHPLASN